MKKALLTAFLMFVAAFVLLFSFQKNKSRVHFSGKKIYTSAAGQLNPPIDKKWNVAPAEVPVKENATAEATEEAGSNDVLDIFFKEMPRASELQNVSLGELHGTPQAVLAAGEKLADIHEYFFQHPQPRDVEMSFYLKCSQQKDFFDSIRAICAARLSQQYFEATGHQISAELFDKNIDQLRREINL